MKPMWVDVLAPTIPATLTLASAAVLYVFAPLAGTDVAIWLGRIYFEQVGSGSQDSFLFWDSFCVVMRMLTSVFSILLVDRIGRPWTLRISVFLTICAAAVLGVFGTAERIGIVGKSTASQYCLAMVIALQGGYGLGLGAVPWVYGPESFEFRIRGPMVGLAVAGNQMTVSFLLYFLSRLYVRVRFGGIFLICTGILGILFIGSLCIFRDRRREVLVDHETITPAAV